MSLNLKRLLKRKSESQLDGIDPFRERILTRLKRTGNPYIPEIKEYMINQVFPPLIELVDSITPEGVDVTYQFLWEDNWFIETVAPARIYSNKIKWDAPLEMVGGKAFFKIFLNEEDVDYKLRVEWEQGKGLRINLDAQTLLALSQRRGLIFDAARLTGNSVDNYLIGSLQAKEEMNGKEETTQKERDLLLALKSMGYAKAHLDMAKVKACSRVDYGGENPEAELGKMISAYFKTTG